MTTTTFPDRTEAAEYDFTYINQVAAGDICRVLEGQLTETLALLNEHFRRAIARSVCP